MKRLFYPASLTLVCLLGTMSLLTGCSTSMSMPDAQGTSDFGVTKGGVFGGQNPISGAHVFVYETQSGGSYGTKSIKSLLGNTTTTLSPDGSCDANVVFPMKRITAAAGGTPTAQCYYQTGGYNGGGAQNTAVGNGEFNLTGLYKCDVGQEVWLFSLNGWPDTTLGDQNPYASLMADLGPCPGTQNFSADTYIYMNELSTVAMAYSISAFAADPTAATTAGANITISAPNSNTAGLINAFNNAQQLYNIEGLTDQGDLSAPHTTTYGARNGIPPYTLINTLGNVLAACINSTGNRSGLVTGSPCYELFLDVYGTSTIVTDTASAMIHVAKNPLAPNPTNLLTVGATNPVWFPYYSVGSAPNDFTVAIAYSGGGSSPYGMVLDPNGNAYVDDYSTSGYMAQFTPLGAVTTTALDLPLIDDGAALAVDSTGLIWTSSINTGAIYDVSNTTALSSVTVAEPAGTLATTTLTYPDLVAADTSGYIYIANPYQNAGTGVIYKTNASGSTTLITPALPGNGCVTNATGVAVNHDGTLWVSGYGTPDLVCRISNNGLTFYTGAANASGFGGSGIISRADAIAAGSATSNGSGNTGGSGSAWVIDTHDSELYNVANNGTTSATVTTAGSGGGMNKPVDIVVDGLGYAWTVNNNAGTGSISAFTPAGVPVSGTNGYQYDLLNAPSALGIDISGNVWVANSGSGNVIEVIGLAAPTQAPVSGNPGVEP